MRKRDLFVAGGTIALGLALIALPGTSLRRRIRLTRKWRNGEQRRMAELAVSQNADWPNGHDRAAYSGAQEQERRNSSGR